MRTIEDAILLAVGIHRGQRDKYGAPYILHPLRVMARVDTPAEKMIAVLHDVLEDSGLTPEDLVEVGYPPDVIQAIAHLTKRPGEAYETYIARVRLHPLARRVKLADLHDNMDVRRFPAEGWGERELARLQRYRRAWETLMAEEEHASRPPDAGDTDHDPEKEP
mgnify:CR=1 FL=1